MIGTLELTVRQLPEMADLQPTQAVTSGLDAESSYALVLRAHNGNLAAHNELSARYLQRLQRWAHGRLPAWARGALDTHDLVQDTFICTATSRPTT